jgi:hypothetical protein
MRSSLPAHKIVTSRKRNLLAAVVVSITIFGYAQTPRQVATVSGTDVTGAIVPNATIRLTHPGDPSLQTTTDVHGRFEMRAKPGEYVLETSAQGFMMDKLPVQLSAATQSTEHIALRVAMGGGVGISIEQPRIETLDASLTATLPLMPVPPYKQSFKKPHPLSK